MVVHTTTYVCSTLGKLAMPPHVSGTLLEYCGSKEQRCLHYACDALSLLPPSTLRRPSVPPAPSRSSVPPAALPSNSKELVPPWFKVCCWSLIKGRPIPPFSFQPYVPYVLLLGQLVARARRHIEAPAEGSEAACSGMGSHCHAARQSQAVSLLLLQSDPTQ